MPDLTLAAQLKEEGNALFIKKDFQKAYQKYTDALKADDTNAILYANRAACAHNLRKCVVHPVHTRMS